MLSSPPPLSPPPFSTVSQTTAQTALQTSPQTTPRTAPQNIAAEPVQLWSLRGRRVATVGGMGYCPARDCAGDDGFAVDSSPTAMAG